MPSTKVQPCPYNFKGTCLANISCSDSSNREPTDNTYDLCSKRILIVGGITKFKAIYKSLIEESGGEFEYMDGYMKGGDKALDSKIKRCDIIFCPVDCNSHNACLSVKKLCKKHKKTFHMLKSSSISGISLAIKNIV